MLVICFMIGKCPWKAVLESMKRILRVTQEQGSSKNNSRTISIVLHSNNKVKGMVHLDNKPHQKSVCMLELTPSI